MNSVVNFLGGAGVGKTYLMKSLEGINPNLKHYKGLNRKNPLNILKLLFWFVLSYEFREKALFILSIISYPNNWFLRFFFALELTYPYFIRTNRILLIDEGVAFYASDDFDKLLNSKICPKAAVFLKIDEITRIKNVLKRGRPVSINKKFKLEARYKYLNKIVSVFNYYDSDLSLDLLFELNLRYNEPPLSKSEIKLFMNNYSEINNDFDIQSYVKKLKIKETNLHSNYEKLLKSNIATCFHDDIDSTNNFISRVFEV